VGVRVLSRRKLILVGVPSPQLRGVVHLNREEVEEDTKVEGVGVPSLSKEVVEVGMVDEAGEGCNYSNMVEPLSTRAGEEGNLSKEVEDMVVVVLEVAAEGHLQVDLDHQHPSCTKLPQLLIQLW
jgi:hypothetical protein